MMVVPPAHPSEDLLRRFGSGELQGPEADAAADCPLGPLHRV